MPTMKYWEVIADKLSGAGWSWSYCSAMTHTAGVESSMCVAMMVAVTIRQIPITAANIEHRKSNAEHRTAESTL